MLQPMAPHAEAEYPSVGGIVEGPNAVSDRGYGWICLDLDDAAKGSVLVGCLMLEAVLGKTQRTEF